ncbi:MAG: DUF3473 domain-containing protein [Chlorobi bacterium]|nr:DUF3473 domain-containing protein [Chlorobiota bacterium]
MDVEEAQDMNFNIKWKKTPDIDYKEPIEWFIKHSKNKTATAFVLGSFAKKHPEIVKELSKHVEIASHGYFHKLVYTQNFKDWEYELLKSKEILEELTQKEVIGYRSPSWSMPFEKRYYEALAKGGFKYSSSYFPMKNYLYGNEINKKKPFIVSTKYGDIQERPIPKDIIPFSGGFYMRVLPLFLLKHFFKKHKDAVMYIHPYELIDKNLLRYFLKYAHINLDYFLAFFHLGSTRKKIKEIVNG